ncbi:LysR family transcriptional regulator [Pyramidobacter sp. SM-530-WT-4B]|uniref:LysR family transcriptional regulator n=1 Tax=Pyramidobacter porci TaxID=2605789 RepID=A0A6L5YC60_9BACT|nr:LysR family transcriptional regulator [Pyramidobacter porci]MST55685.1 LysR family transcriptional regulator [Pyramidobacter porci]
MDFKDAKIYLELCNSRNITQTARVVGLTQSAVTQRLQNLEREFGFQLVLRERGQKTIELTAQGVRLLPIIQQWADLYESAYALRNETARTSVKIACTESIGSYLLPKFFFDYAQSHKNLALSIHNSHSWEIFDSLESGSSDIGLTNRETSLFHEQLQIVPVYRESYVLLTSKANRAEYSRKIVHPKDLDVSRELFFDITPSFTQWRKSWWEEKRPFVQTSFAQILPPMLSNSPYWSILPLSIARSFAQQYNLDYYLLAQEPERRTCSIVTNRQSRTYKATEKEALISALTEFFKRLEQQQ